MAKRRILPKAPPLPPELHDLVCKLADSAVTQGRMNWDGYYGRNNDYHLDGLEDWDEYQALAETLNKTIAK